LLGLYLHIPFCLKKCHYCDFNSYPLLEGVAGTGTYDLDAYTEALNQELLIWARVLRAELVPDSGFEPVDPREGVEVVPVSGQGPSPGPGGRGPGLGLRSVFIGGGTPTCLGSRNLVRLLNTISRIFSPGGSAQRASGQGAAVTPLPEITVEINPGTAARGLLEALRAAGVNRLSIGVQSFSDRLLRRLGRLHDAAAAREAFFLARQAGYENINLDLIYGIPGQGLDDWRKTLTEAVRLGPEHLAVYGLKIEEGTPFAVEVEAGTLEPVDDDLQLRMWDEATNRLQREGYLHYEVSNYSRPGYRCRHNLIYWRNGEYLGCGAGAHSHLQGWRFRNTKEPNRYQELLEKGRLPIEAGEKILPRTEMIETVIMGLRLREGIDLSGFARRFGCSLTDAFGQAVEKSLSRGLARVTEGRLVLTPRGLRLSNEVLVEFVD